MNQKIIFIIMGVLLCIGGAYCLVTPGLTYMTIAPLAGIGMLVDAFASFFAWNALRKAGIKDTLTLISAILSVVLGAALLCSFGAQMVYDLMVAYMVAAWLIFNGVLRIALGWKKDKNVPLIAVGALLVICGAVGLFNPFSIMLALGMIIGMSILMAGISVLFLALAI